jgi:hypothetical protein
MSGKITLFQHASKFRASLWALLLAASLILMTGMPSTAFAEPVKVKAWSSGGQIPGTLTVTTVEPGKPPTVQTFQTNGTPPEINIPNLPPGTHIFHFEGTNIAGRTEKGVMQYTVVAGAEHKVGINTQVGDARINDPQSGTTGTAANGATRVPGRTALKPNIPEGIRGSIKLGGYAHMGTGIDTLALYNGGNALGRNALEADADHVGGSVSGTIGYSIPNPETGGGAQRMFFGLGAGTIWGESVTKIDRIDAGVGNIFESPGVNVLSNVALNSATNVEARSEIDEHEISVRMGLIYFLGEAGASLGNMIFGNLSGADRDRQDRFLMQVTGDIFYRARDRMDTLTYEAGGQNRYDSTIETDEVGFRIGSSLKMPVTRGVFAKVGGDIAVISSSDDLSVTQLRASNNDSFSTSDDQLTFELGLAAALSTRAFGGTFTAYTNYKRRNDAAVLVLPGSNDSSDVTRIGYESTDSIGFGIQYYRSFSTSDIRVKTDIVRLGTLPSGLPVYSYKYIWSGDSHVGVMAQEARLLYPDAVREIDGFLAVDYSKIR